MSGKGEQFRPTVRLHVELSPSMRLQRYLDNLLEDPSEARVIDVNTQAFLPAEDFAQHVFDESISAADKVLERVPRIDVAGVATIKDIPEMDEYHLYLPTRSRNLETIGDAVRTLPSMEHHQYKTLLYWRVAKDALLRSKAERSAARNALVHELASNPNSSLHVHSPRLRLHHLNHRRSNNGYSPDY